MDVLYLKGMIMIDYVSVAHCSSLASTIGWYIGQTCTCEICLFLYYVSLCIVLAWQCIGWYHRGIPTVKCLNTPWSLDGYKAVGQNYPQKKKHQNCQDSSNCWNLPSDPSFPEAVGRIPCWPVQFLLSFSKVSRGFPWFPVGSHGNSLGTPWSRRTAKWRRDPAHLHRSTRGHLVQPSHGTSMALPSHGNNLLEKYQETINIQINMYLHIFICI